MDNEIRKVILTVDPVVFRFHNGRIEFLAVKRTYEPFTGRYALPGAMFDPDKDQDITAVVERRLREKTGLSGVQLEQVYTTGGPERDHRGWSVSIIYMGMIKADDDTELTNEAEWLPLSEAKDLAFDHSTIVMRAFGRLKGKATYTALPFALMAEKFTLPEALQVFEVVLGRSIELKTFMRRSSIPGLLEPVGQTSKPAGKGRPAQLYRLIPGQHNHIFERTLAHLRTAP